VRSLKKFAIGESKFDAISVNVIIPVYGERSDALAATLTACLKQTYPISEIFVVDDGSVDPVSLPDWAQNSPIVQLLRLPQNRGISGARNAAIALSHATLLACINTEIVPEADWLATCVRHLAQHPYVGACFTRVVPQNPNKLLSRWRMRFQEPAKYGQLSGPAVFAPGHAVLFRKEAVDQVGGYDIRYRRRHEDSDICIRMRRVGWETHYTAQSSCVSIQRDSLSELSRKQLRDSDWFAPGEYSFFRLFLLQCRWLFVRLARNLLRGRILFLPIDVAIWGRSLQIALSSNLRKRYAQRKAGKMNAFSTLAVRVRWTSRLLSQDLLTWRGRSDFFAAFRSRNRISSRIQPIHLVRGIVFVDGKTSVIDLRTFAQVFLDEVYSGLEFRDCAVIDIGAHKGYFAAYAMLRGAKAVICYEPEDSNFRALSLFAESTDGSKRVIELHQEAGGEDGEAQLYVSSESWCHSTIARPELKYSKTINVPSRSLPNILLEARKRFTKDNIILKIDAEGAECPLLLNASAESLSEVREIIFEFHTFSHCSLQHIVEKLSSVGFEYITIVKQADLHHFRNKASFTVRQKKR
jgi:FkbM family methyltransferase